jgi:A nuclease of the HNH/ENDO VII superfamily with conserved WHH
MAESESSTESTSEEEKTEVVSFGLWWPAGDPDKLREAATAWDDMASHLETATTTLTGAASTVTQPNTGAAINAFHGHWQRTGGPEGALPTIAGHCRTMATACREFADEIDEARKQILQLAAEIVASVAIGVGLAFFTAGISAAAVTATTARIVGLATQIGVNVGFRAATIISRVAVIGAVGSVESMATNTIVQLGSNATFNDNHNPFDGWSWSELGTSGAFGFAGGGTIAGIQGLRWLRRIPTIGGKPPINSANWAGRVYGGDVWKKNPNLATKYPNGLRFTKQGFPDFSPYAKGRVVLDDLTGNYYDDAAAANRALGLPRTPKGWTWQHVEDGRTMLLVPQDIHKVAHTGGAAVIRNNRAWDPDKVTGPSLPYQRAVNAAAGSSTAATLD